MNERRVFTVRISNSIIKPLKLLSVEIDRTMGNLVEEAIQDLLEKYNKSLPKKSPKK